MGCPIENELLHALLALCIQRTACPDCNARAGAPCMTATGRLPGTPVSYHHDGRAKNGHAAWSQMRAIFEAQVCARCGHPVDGTFRHSWHPCEEVHALEQMAERGMMARISALEAEVALLRAAAAVVDSPT